MIRSINKDIVCPANTETLADYFVGIEGTLRKVLFIWHEVTGDLDVRAYLEQDRVVDVGGECDAVVVLAISLDLDVPTGKTFKAGFLNNSGGALTAKLTVFYEEG